MIRGKTADFAFMCGARDENNILDRNSKIFTNMEPSIETAVVVPYYLTHISGIGRYRVVKTWGSLWFWPYRSGDSSRCFMSISSLVNRKWGVD